MPKKPTYSDIITYSAQVQSVAQDARDAFMQALQNIDFDDWTQAVADLRTVITNIVDYFGLASSELGAQWYEYCKQLEATKGFTAIVGEVSRYSLKSDVDAVVDKLFNGEIGVEELTAQLAGVVVNQVQKQARDTVLENLLDEYNEAWEQGEYDYAKSLGYARVPVGDSCAFCITIASKGFVYLSERSALKTKDGDKYHPNCNCTAVPFTKASEIPGYSGQLAKYTKMYEKADRARISDDIPPELKKHIAETKERHDKLYDEGKEPDRWSSLNETLIIMRYQNEGMH